MKIAVCISGLLKYWDFTAQFFETWNDMFEDVEFYFYLCTWKDDNVWVFDGTGDNSRNAGLTSVDLSQYSFLNDYERIDCDDIEEMTKDWNDGANKKHYFAKNMSGVFKLLSNQTHQFDSVIWTRNDYLWARDGLDTVINDTKLLKEDNIICEGNGHVLDKTDTFLGIEYDYKYTVRDYCFLFHPSLVREFSNMFDVLYVKNTERVTFSLGSYIRHIRHPEHHQKLKPIFHSYPGLLLRSKSFLDYWSADGDVNQKFNANIVSKEEISELIDKFGFDWFLTNYRSKKQLIELKKLL